MIVTVSVCVCVCVCVEVCVVNVLVIHTNFSTQSLSSSPHTQYQRTVIINDGNPGLWSTCPNSYGKTLVPLETNGIINDVKRGTPCGGSVADGEGDGACGSDIVLIGCRREHPTRGENMVPTQLNYGSAYLLWVSS